MDARLFAELLISAVLALLAYWLGRRDGALLGYAQGTIDAREECRAPGDHSSNIT